MKGGNGMVHEKETHGHKDIFTDIQAKIGCAYISDLPYHKRVVWHEMKRLNLADYDTKQLEDFSRYVFDTNYQTLQAVMEQQKGREELCRKQGYRWKYWG